VQVSNTEAQAAAAELGLGPVNGNVTEAVGIKTEEFTLPQNALVSCSLPAQSHQHASIQASSKLVRASCNLALHRMPLNVVAPQHHCCMQWVQEPKEDRCLRIWCVGQVGSPLPAPEPVQAPAPDGTQIIAMVLNGSSSWPSALGPAALDLSRDATDNPEKARGAQDSVPAAPEPMPSQAAAATVVTTGSSTQPSQSQPAAPTASNAMREAVSYTIGGR
jgi:hypothetical protein